MSVIGSNILAGAAGQGGGYTIEESLRFNSSQSSYLSWTPATAGNRTTWTWSGWVKKSDADVANYTERVLFSAGTLGSVGAQFGFISFSTYSGTTGINNSLRFANGVWGVSGDYDAATTSNYRDPSAWYHVIVAFDSTNGTPANRVKLYINGVLLTNVVGYAGRATTASLNYAPTINNNVAHYVGGFPGAGGYNPWEGYLTEVNFIDGQALTPSSFGEYNATTGVWQPVGYTGTYGTNGFYLPMKLDNTTEGFNTVTWVGNNSTQKIGGVGFSPDLVWIKNRTNSFTHLLYDSVRGAGTLKAISSSETTAEGSMSDNATFGYLDSINSDGFTVISGSSANSYTNSSSNAYVGWCWDAGSSTVSNTDGSITSSVRSNPAYGFSVVTYTGNGNDYPTGATVGHGLGAAPQLVIAKSRGTSGTNWAVWHDKLAAADYTLLLNNTGAQASGSSAFNRTLPTSTVFSVGQAAGGTRTNEAGVSHVAYCFSEIAGYSKFGSYTGNGSATGPTVTTGFKPAFVMVKSASTGGWVMLDTTRDTVNPAQKYLYAQSSAAEAGGSVIADINSDGFQLKNAWTDVNGSGTTYIYMAFADTREYAFWLDDSGNNNDWQPNGGITTGSTVTDTPTIYADGGNYCTGNPLIMYNGGGGAAIVPKNGNLDLIGGNGWATIGSTFAVSTGKWYWEATFTIPVTGDGVLGIHKVNTSLFQILGYSGDPYGYAYGASGNKLNNTTGSAYGATYTNGDVIGVALDLDAGTLTFYKNNVSQGVAFSSLSGEFFPAFSSDKAYYQANFGQRPFAYTPPTGFKSLHTGNLPDSAIENGSKYFNAITYTGTGASVARTGVGFQPDLVWYKSRSVTENHQLFDVVRGVQQSLYSNLTNAEATDPGVYSFDSDGFTAYNSAYTYVAWNWKAGGAAVTNTAGSITSQVSASPTAGFSVVTYTEPSGTFSFGHGLGVTPAMVIIKNRGVGNWIVWHKSFATPPTTAAMYLNTTTAVANSGGTWLNSVSSTVVDMNSGQFTGPGTKVAYCFSEVPSYSKFGSYVGNGSTDGPFVNLGFRARFILTKATQQGSQWFIWDTARELDNPNNSTLFPESSQAETSNNSALDVDVLSNGFKIRNTGSGQNNNGYVYIYMAFAENPFKNSLAR
tara:strand:- start:7346 stop:10762 length:3417 start_codon:yes stop_codon:yes gene_type:complete